MTTEFEGGGSLLHDQRMQTVRNLFCAGGDGGLFLGNNFSLTTAGSTPVMITNCWR